MGDGRRLERRATVGELIARGFDEYLPFHLQGTLSKLIDEAIAKGRADLLPALEEAESMLLAAMHNDLDFKKETREEIIASHPGMKKIRDAIAEAKGQ